MLQSAQKDVGVVDYRLCPLVRNVSLHVSGDAAHLLQTGLAQTFVGSESFAAEESVAHDGQVAAVGFQTEQGIVPLVENDPDGILRSQPVGSSVDAQHHPGRWTI